jgi:tRNA pseudouridine38-40 synthase
MQIAAEKIRNTHNFKSFCKAHSSNKTYECKINTSGFYEKGEFLIYKIAANRFLYGMVRAITGTLVQIGSGKLKLQSLAEIIEMKDRTKVTKTAPAKGLILDRILY